MLDQESREEKKKAEKINGKLYRCVHAQFCSITIKKSMVWFLTDNR